MQGIQQSGCGWVGGKAKLAGQASRSKRPHRMLCRGAAAAQLPQPPVLRRSTSKLRSADNSSYSWAVTYSGYLLLAPLATDGRGGRHRLQRHTPRHAACWRCCGGARRPRRWLTRCLHRGPRALLRRAAVRAVACKVPALVAVAALDVAQPGLRRAAVMLALAAAASCAALLAAAGRGGRHRGAPPILHDGGAAGVHQRPPTT